MVVASIKEYEGRLFIYLNKVGKDVWFPKKISKSHPLFFMCVLTLDQDFVSE